MKGIVLAGGSGSRLYPATGGICKQLLPVYDKPMIYYPLSVLMLAGIRDILLVCTAHDRPSFVKLLGNGGRFGVRLHYAVQSRPQGLAHGLLLGADFVGGDTVCLILGDNLFYGQSFGRSLQQAAADPQGATVFACQVAKPQHFGIVSFDEYGKALTLEEKPANPASDWAVGGLYFYDRRAVAFARSLRPSARGEWEITDLNRRYLDAGCLNVHRLGHGSAWFDMGTPQSLHEASAFVQTVQNDRQRPIACLEEIGWQQGWLKREILQRAAAEAGDSAYGRYLRRLAA